MTGGRGKEHMGAFFPIEAKLSVDLHTACSVYHVTLSRAPRLTR